ncbi:MAG: sulfurtransferase [Candidatus Glassbacteria bacterium]|nr:sulfurtransferase [Candidatus Glassbacteria bacterium]
MTGSGWTKLLFAALLVIACGASEQHENSSRPLVVANEPAVRYSMLVSTEWLSERLGADELVILHVSARRDGYDREHIPAARYVGWDQITESDGGIANELPPVEKLTLLVRGLGIDRNSRVVIYDEGNGIMAARAYLTLDYLGLGENSALLDGQLVVWKAEGRPLSDITPEVQLSAFQPEVNSNIVAGMDEVQQIVGGGDTPLLDCRPPDQFSGEAPGGDIGRGGHIPGAFNLPVIRSLAGPDNPKLLEIDELRALYSQAGFSGDMPVVSYCRTGRSASLSYFVLKYLGYDARLYDGSFSQWQGVEENPVETGQ